GTLHLAATNNFHVHGDQTFLLLTATGGITGTFSNLVSDISAMTTSLDYGANGVTLTATGPTFQAVGSTKNQKAIRALVDSFQAGGTHAALVDYLSSLSDADLQEAYDRISPSNLAPMFRMGFASAQVRSGAVRDRLSSVFGGSRSDEYASWNGGALFAANI